MKVISMNVPVAMRMIDGCDIDTHLLGDGKAALSFWREKAKNVKNNCQITLFLLARRGRTFRAIDRAAIISYARRSI